MIFMLFTCTWGRPTIRPVIAVSISGVGELEYQLSLYVSLSGVGAKANDHCDCILLHVLKNHTRVSDHYAFLI